MRRMKALLVLITIVFSLSFAGCSQAVDDESNIANLKESDLILYTEETETTVSSEITLEDVMNAPESPAEDFSGGDNGKGGYSISGYDGNDEIVIIPDEIDGLPVTEIEKYAFSNDRTETVRAIRLSDSVSSMEDGWTFCNNEILEIFVSGSGLEIIGENSFQFCTSLKTVILNEGLMEIQDDAFRNCSTLSELTIPSTVETMGTMCIYNPADDFVLYGKAGSIVEEYATEYSITFNPIYG